MSDGALRIGVTGHRLLLDVDVLRASVQKAISTLRVGVEHKQVVIYSSLAEGADRLVVEEAMAHHGATLAAILPMPAPEYVKDCTDASSRRQLYRLLGLADETIVLPPSNSRIAAYWQAGTYVVDNVDVLIALWDGQPAQGKSGTAEVIDYARSRCRPLIWIHAGNRHPGTSTPTTLGPTQGRITTERLPHWPAVDDHKPS